VQLNIGHVDEAGIYTGEFTTVALAGRVRVLGEADSAVDHLWRKLSAEVRANAPSPTVRPRARLRPWWVHISL